MLTRLAVCTPTRYGLVTGNLLAVKNERGVLNGYSALIDPDRYTIADLMKDAGYNTACIGKWHLGMDMPKQADGKSWDWTGTIANGPNVNGFDYFYGITASLDFPPYVYVENDQFATPVTGRVEKKAFPAFWREGELGDGFVHRESLDHLTEKVVGYIAEHAGKDELFSTSPDESEADLPAERFVGKSGIGPYGDFIIQTDDVLGVDQAAQDAGVKDNTLVIFTSDNGSYMYRYNDDQPTRRRHDPGVPLNDHRPITLAGRKQTSMSRATACVHGDCRVRSAGLGRGPCGEPCRPPRDARRPDRAGCASGCGRRQLQHAATHARRVRCTRAGSRDHALGQWHVRDPQGQVETHRGQRLGWPWCAAVQAVRQALSLYDLESDPSETTSLIEERADVARTMEQLLLLMLGPDAVINKEAHAMAAWASIFQL